jgi:hypothetical protein
MPQKSESYLSRKLAKEAEDTSSVFTSGKVLSRNRTVGKIGSELTHAIPIHYQGFANASATAIALPHEDRLVLIRFSCC